MTEQIVYVEDCTHCNHTGREPGYGPNHHCRTCWGRSKVLRVAFCGSSGTGKSTLASHVAEKYGLPLNPIGSRSVSKAMGFESPYDVDKAGRRAEFQRRLVDEKRAWEVDHKSFVTDRTTLDNLAYTMLHDVHAIDDALMASTVAGLYRYTHVVYCPVSAFCNLEGSDKARVKDRTYQILFDVLVEALVSRALTRAAMVYPSVNPERTRLFAVNTDDLTTRCAQVDTFLSGASSWSITTTGRTDNSPL